MATKQDHRWEGAPLPADEAATQSTEPEADVTTAFDREASNATIHACAGISSLSSTAVEDATGAASPFLTFAQRTRIRALSTNFDFQAGGAVIVQAPAVRQVETEVVGGAGLTREEVDAIVAHRVEIAVTETLKALGLSPDSTLEAQIGREVEARVGGQEHRLLEYVKRHLTDSLEMLESSLDERIAEFVETAAGTAARTKEEDREVEEQLEEARENLLKNIDEVRTIDVGFDIGDFAASIVELDRSTGPHDSAAIEAALDANGDDGAFEMAADDDVEADADDADVEDLDADAAVSADEGSADEVEIGELSADEALADVGPGDGMEVEVAVDVGSSALLAQVDLDDLDADDVMRLDVDERVLAPIEMSVADGVEDQLEVILGSEADEFGTLGTETLGTEGASLELDDFEAQEDLEEISVIQPMPESGSDGEVIDLDVDMDEDGDEGDLSLMTLGEGPDEIRVGDLDAPFSEDEFEIDVEDEAEIEVDEGKPGEESNDATVRKYIDKAVQMSLRQPTVAMELYSKVLDIEPDHFDALVSRGMIYVRSKDYRRATEDFRRAQNVAPERAGSHFGVAELHYNRRQFNKAIKNYNLALERDDMLAEAYCRRGLSYYYLKNYKNAFHDLYRAYDIDPELPKIRSFLKLVQNKIKEGEG